ncbi:hypothetical protein NPIL_324311 [Nephila pilipes]|uniref:Uncharacterized protein n=1 Tax=Nephila pilipes TaxID=299642 RepID=A0A8X6URW7_NEPPI|nr:hypothetical protein NPIL_324311 [Nephila pilipes]
MKIEIVEDLNRTVCPNQCETHTDSDELGIICRDLYYSENPQPLMHKFGTKMNVSEKEGFISPTKTAKQPRKEKFTLLISNTF